MSRIFLLVVLVFYLTLLGLMRNSERPGFPISVALGKGRPALRISIVRVVTFVTGGFFATFDWSDAC